MRPGFRNQHGGNFDTYIVIFLLPHLYVVASSYRSNRLAITHKGLKHTLSLMIADIEASMFSPVALFTRTTSLTPRPEACSPSICISMRPEEHHHKLEGLQPSL